MLLNIIFSILTYFLIGIIIFHFIDIKRAKNNTILFVSTYMFALTACIVFYVAWIKLGLPEHKGVEGLFAPDSSTYYLDAVRIVRENFSSEVLGNIITDHYHELFMAVQLLIFGEHVLIPKIYQVFLFSIGLVLWVNIAGSIFKNQRIERYFYYLLLFCVPLLTYTAYALKEIPLFFATSVAIYGFTKYNYSYNPKLKHVLTALIGIFLMFMFRRQFALVMFFSLFAGFILGSNLSFKKKILWASAFLIFYIIINNLAVFQQIGATNPLTQGALVRAGRTRGSTLAVEDGGMLSAFLAILQNPLVVGPYFIYGVFQLFFHPPFLLTPTQLLSRDLSYLTMGYYNLFFTLMLPAFYFGAKHLYKNNKGNPVLIAILVYFIFASMGTIFGSDSYRRFKISYFWPIAYIYISYGIATYPIWKKKLPLVLIVFFALFLMYFSFDLIGFAS